MTSLRRSLLRGATVLLLAATWAPGAQAETGANELRFSGPPELLPLLTAWEDGFRRANPDMQFTNELTGRNAAIYGIEMRIADIALLDRPINPFERYGTYEHSWIFPVEIEAATDGVGTGADPGTQAVFVHQDSALARLTLGQLDGIFGAQRDGGFDKLEWDEKAARPASANLRTWGQLGIGGPLASHPLHVYGPASYGAGIVTFFQQKVFRGGAMRNEALREYADPKAMFAAMAADPDAIGYGPLAAMPAGFKPVALAATEGGPFALPSPQTLADRTYPLAKPISLNFTIDTPSGQLAEPRVEPKIMAFVSYVLGPEGQAAVRADGHYLPLTADEVKRQLATLNSREAPSERPK